MLDGTGAVVPRATLLVRDARIVAVGPEGAVQVPPDATRMDVGGRTIVPGLVNAHGHVGETRGLESKPELATRDNVLAQLRLYAQYGITTVASLGGDHEASASIRNTQRAGTVNEARLLIAGQAIRKVTLPDVLPLLDESLALHPDIVKIAVDDNLGTTPKMPPDVYRELIARAKARSLRVAAHVFYLDDAKALLRAGVDVLAHSVRDRAIDAELVDLARTRDACVIPTLVREVSTFVYRSEPAFFSDPFFLRHADRATMDAVRAPDYRKGVRESPAAVAYEKALGVASTNLKALVDAGVRVAMGTDSGPPARFQGYFEHMELELMAKAGLTPAQILKAATSDAARCLGLSDGSGVLRAGSPADFLVLRESPERDITRLRTIEAVWIGGRAFGPI